jgi:hypothetical protein
MEDIIKKINKLSYNSSNSWIQMTKNLENYLINGDLELYLINNIEPQIFT